MLLPRALCGVPAPAAGCCPAAAPHAGAVLPLGHPCRFVCWLWPWAPKLLGGTACTHRQHKGGQDLGSLPCGQASHRTPACPHHAEAHCLCYQAAATLTLPGCDPSRMSCYSLVPRCRGALHLCRAAPARCCCCCCDAGCVCLLLASQVLQVAHRGQQVVLHNSQACRGAPTLLQQRHLLQHAPLEAYDAVHLREVEHGRD